MHVQTVEYHISNVHHMLTMTANDQIYSSFQFSSVLMRIQSIVYHTKYHISHAQYKIPYNIQYIQTLANKQISTHIFAKQQHKFTRMHTDADQSKVKHSAFVFSSSQQNAVRIRDNN